MPRTATAPRRARVSRLPGIERREHLLDAAAELLRAGDPRAVTMEAVALHAGVSKGLGYVHFRNASDLLLALYDREVGEVYCRIDDAMQGAGGFDAQLEAAVRAYYDAVIERGAVLGLLRARLSDRAARRRLRRRIATYLHAWARRLEGAFAVSPGASHALAVMALTAAEASVRAWRASRSPRKEAEALLVAFVRGGLHEAAASRERHGPARSGRARIGSA